MKVVIIMHKRPQDEVFYSIFEEDIVKKTKFKTFLKL